MKRDRSNEERTPYRWVVSVSVMALIGIALVSWSGPPRGFDLVSRAWANDAHHQNDDEFGPEQTLLISLHGTKQGHPTFYSEAYGGFEIVTGIPFRQGNVGAACLDACHIPATGCISCHTDPEGGAVPSDAELDQKCLLCHGRQGLEAQFRQMGWLTDVHYDSTHKEFHCMTCHTKREMHGDENVYSSLLAPEAMDAKCTNCHPVKKLLKGNGVNAYHAIHLDDVDCSACHVQSVLVCQSCHFDSLLETTPQQVFWGPTLGFKLLVQHDGKVHAASYMTLTDEQGENGQTFVVIAPNHVHAVTSGADLSCRDCHKNAAVKQYIHNKPIDVVTWDDTKNSLVPRMGIIPVPPDWQTALQFDFAVPTGIAEHPWVKLKTGADQSQILFAKPLSQEQMDALSTPHGSP
jgi:hypothetical protein